MDDSRLAGRARSDIEPNLAMPELHERHSQAICGRSGAVDERKILTTKEADELDKVEMVLGWNENVEPAALDRGDPHDRSGGMSLTTTAVDMDMQRVQRVAWNRQRRLCCAGQWRSMLDSIPKKCVRSSAPDKPNI